ncbi:MAG: YhjD/YihY/BrkB family envelope integrity protein [Kibdelosporangium sp.]
MKPVSVLVHAVVAHTRRALRGRDVALWTAGLTFYVALAMVPMLLLVLRGTAEIFGQDFVTEGVRALGAALPKAHDAAPALDALSGAALDASWVVLLAALIPATMYGEGLRRGLNQIAGSPASGRTGWAGRFAFLPLLLAGPLLVAPPLAIAPEVTSLYQAGGWSTVLGVVLSFHIDLVPISLATAGVFALAGPAALPVRSALLAGLAVGATLTGFLHGFIVFLAIPIDWSVPFGGLSRIADVVAIVLWLFLLHLVLLFGYRIALSARLVVRPKGASDVVDRPNQREVAQGSASGPAAPAQPGTHVPGG